MWLGLFTSLAVVVIWLLFYFLIFRPQVKSFKSYVDNLKQPKKKED